MASKLDQYLKFITQLVENGHSITSLADRYGVARSTMSTFLAANDVEVKPASITVISTDEEVSREERLDAENRELRSQVRRARTADVQADRIEQEIITALEDIEFGLYEPPETPAGGYDHNPHVQALLLSDLHAGETVDPEAINGINEFSWDVLTQRMANIQRSLISYKDARPYEIEELHIWSLGDINGGAHHEELAITNELPEAEQCVKTGVMLAEWIEELVPHYPKIKVSCVHGNHGRVPRKPASKQQFNNFDWITANLAAQALRGYDSIEFDIARGGQIVTEVAGLKYLLWHGDGIRSSMPGVPWGGVMRRTNELRKQYAEQGIHLDGFALGHFHQANAVQNILMNGSVKGPDEWVLKQFGYAEQAAQLLVTFDPRKSRRTDVSYINP